MKKIVITGGLGYVGWELCKLYSGETRYNDIIVTDNKFLSDKVNQLASWGFTFIQDSILNESGIKSILDNADIVYHLAGITDVAYTKSESNETKDLQLKQIALDGTKNILQHMSQKSKIIFASTHVVYEGYDSTVFDLTEEAELKPVLAYSTSKAQNEYDVQNSNKNYVILRFGSVYGYSEDTMRINIMPNLFSKMSTQNQTIKLFGGGVQYKPLVAVVDVARCLKFMGESNITNEIFNLCNENLTVKEVANIIKKHNKNTNIIETQDEIPNKGYTLSNKKLLDTGFKFLYNIDKCIEEMVHKWTKKQPSNELEYKINGGKEFKDERGKISNYELTEPINLIGWIESKAGTVRANHYHPIQEQKCLLISGKYVSVIKDLATPNAEIKTQIINPGDIAVIQPNVAHTMVFLEDSLFLNLVRGEREHENYGITHTISYQLVDEKYKNELIKKYSHE